VAKRKKREEGGEEDRKAPSTGTVFHPPHHGASFVNDLTTLFKSDKLDSSKVVYDRINKLLKSPYVSSPVWPSGFDQEVMHMYGVLASEVAEHIADEIEKKSKELEETLANKSEFRRAAEEWISAIRAYTRSATTLGNDMALLSVGIVALRLSPSHVSDLANIILRGISLAPKRYEPAREEEK